MDSTTVIQLPRDETAARNRFENFKLGKGLPSTISNPSAGSRHGHARSHSRNKSISNSLSFSSSTNMNDMATFSFPMSNSTPAISSVDTLPDPPRPLSQPVISPNLGPPSKRASHHRRRSSVSTRRESAELMGITLPDLPASASEDNINLGEKDSIRRRALWALEGKPDVSFNKVEIPELATPDMEKLMFDFPTKQSLSTGPSCAFGSAGIGSKRDSFKLLGPSSCTKDLLHTLLEEEEEEEEEEEDELVETSRDEPSFADQSAKENIPPLTPSVGITKATPSKPRPANLNLRPLALTPEALTAVQGLPTPTTTPSPRSGLRPLSLTSNGSETSESTKQERRSSSIVSPSPASRRPILNLSTENLETPPIKSQDDKKSSRRSSISYKRSSYNGVISNLVGLPTPEMTPTFGRRYSNTEYSGVLTAAQMTPSSISDDEFFPNPPTQSRPLSTSEQHFLFKSHHALVARISELERALSVLRRRESGGYAISNSGSSRPQSMVSDSSLLAASDTGSEPVSDEMLQLISDLKAERDELMKDMDGWRQRVADLENQNGILVKRVDNERREAWVARSQTGILEHENDVLAKKLTHVEEQLKIANTEALQLGTENKALKTNKEEFLNRIAQLEAQLNGLRDELANERKAKEDALATPRAEENHAGLVRHSLGHGMGLPSLDSESSMTDVESSDEGHVFGFTLKSVQEEDENNFSDDDGLAGYEDEDEEDTNMSLQSSSSFDSEDDTPYPPRIGASEAFSTPPRIFSKPASDPRTWTFPKVQPRAATVESSEKEDRFFGCLDDDSETAGSVPSSPSGYSYEKSKGLFARGFQYAEDDDAAFFVPSGLGLPVHLEEDSAEHLNNSLTAEDDYSNDFESDTDVDDASMFGHMGGITITFTPPQEEPLLEEKKQLQVSPSKRTSPPPTLPALNFGNVEEDDDQTVAAPFTFGPMFKEKATRPIPELAPDNPVGPSIARSVEIATPHPRPLSPSMIPRAASPSSSVVKRSASPPRSSPESPMMSFKSFNTSLFMEPLILDNTFHVTPPAKRAAPSFIPQPVASPSPIRSVPAFAKPRLSSVSPTLIRQPTRVPLLPASVPKTSVQPTSRKTNGSTMIPQTSPFLPIASPSMNLPSLFRFSDNDAAFDHTETSVVNTSAGQLDTKSDGPSQNSRSTSQIILPNMSQASSPAVSARLSFQTLTNFIAPWSIRPLSAAPVSNDLQPLHPTTLVVKKDAFVPRERQLRKLKARIEREGMISLAHCTHLQCSDCQQKIVVL